MECIKLNNFNLNKMEAFRNNFVFILYTGWIMLAVALFVVGGYSSIVDEKHPFYKHRIIAWIVLALFWVIMFILQNIYIYLYT